MTRLDGYTVDDVLKLIDHGSRPVTQGRVVLDQRASWLALGNAWLKAAADRLTGRRARGSSPARGDREGRDERAVGDWLLLLGIERPRDHRTKPRDRVRARRPRGEVRQLRWPNLSRAARHLAPWILGEARDVFRGRAAVTRGRPHSGGRDRRGRACGRAVSRRDHQAADPVSRLLSGHESRRVVLPRHAQRELADDRRR